MKKTSYKKMKLAPQRKGGGFLTHCDGQPPDFPEKAAETLKKARRASVSAKIAIAGVKRNPRFL